MIFHCIGAIPAYDCFAEAQLSFAIYSLSCTGNETGLLDCTHNVSIDQTCDTYDDAGVICQSMYQDDCQTILSY